MYTRGFLINSEYCRQAELLIYISQGAKSIPRAPPPLQPVTYAK